MSFAIETDESVVDGFRRVATEQIDKAIASLDGEDEHEAVHDVRKRCKKVRGLCRLVRGAFDDYGEVNAHFRDTARLLSDLRDATALLETVDALAKRRGDALDEEAVAALRAALERRRERVAERDALDERLGEVRQRLLAARARVGDWELGDEGFDAIEGGMVKTYARARRRAFDAGERRRDDEHFHEWRKRVKYHRYHMDLLAPLWPKVLEAREELCHHLTDLLGDDHDLVVLRARLEDEEIDRDVDDLAAVVDGLGRRRREALREESVQLGLWLFVDEPDAFAARLRSRWEAARS